MAKTKNILIVEDIFKSIIHLKRELEDEEEYAVDLAGDVQSALEAISQKKYDVLLVDWFIPLDNNSEISDDGAITLLNQLYSRSKNNEEFATPFIIVTAQPDAIDFDKLQPFSNYIGCVYKLFPDDVKDKLSAYFNKSDKKDSTT